MFPQRVLADLLGGASFELARSASPSLPSVPAPVRTGQLSARPSAPPPQIPGSLAWMSFLFISCVWARKVALPTRFQATFLLSQESSLLIEIPDLPTPKNESYSKYPQILGRMSIPIRNTSLNRRCYV